jgi:hypothetical protein
LVLTLSEGRDFAHQSEFGLNRLLAFVTAFLLAKAKDSSELDQTFRVSSSTSRGTRNSLKLTNRSVPKEYSNNLVTVLL